MILKRDVGFPQVTADYQPPRLLAVELAAIPPAKTGKAYAIEGLAGVCYRLLSGGRDHEIKIGKYDTGVVLSGGHHEEKQRRQEFLDQFSTAINLTADDGSAAALHIQRRAIGPPGSRQTIKQILRWLSDCDHLHKSCQENIGYASFRGWAPLPKRLIDVGTFQAGSKLRLMETYGRQGRYITLSHCWGSSGWKGTLKENIKALMEGIDFETLPKTFQDAITITRQLGERYLWIDTYCIIQDDKYDWERESGKMCRIYGDAYLNIAATAAEDCHSGIFPSRPEITSVKVPCFPHSGDDDCFYFTTQPACNFQAEIEGAKLNTRGWVLQERILSRRTVHFGKTQVFFECSRQILAEDGTHVETEDNHLPNSLSRAVKAVRPCTRIKDAEKPFYRNEVEATWKRVMEKYSRCQLTYSTDKLPALAGIAEAVKGQTGLKFHYGHWFDGTEKLPTSLLWSTADDYEGSRGFETDPSWACTTLPAPIIFQETNTDLQCKLVKEIYLRPRKSHLEHPDPSIHPDVTGNTFLRIRGRVRTALVDDNGILHHIFMNMRYNIGGVSFDSPRHKPREFQCLFMYRAQSRYQPGLTSVRNILLLERIPFDDPIPMYRRIGTGTVTTDSFFNSTPETVVDII